MLLCINIYALYHGRAYSSWNMEVRTDKESLPFEECLERELSSSMGAMRTYGTAEYHYIQRGFYMDQIERFQKTFPDRFGERSRAFHRMLLTMKHAYSLFMKYVYFCACFYIIYSSCILFFSFLIASAGPGCWWW